MYIIFRPTIVQNVTYFRFCGWRHFFHTVNGVQMKITMILVHFQRLRQGPSRCLALSSYTIAANCACTGRKLLSTIAIVSCCCMKCDTGKDRIPGEVARLGQQVSNTVSVRPIVACSNLES